MEHPISAHIDLRETHGRIPPRSMAAWYRDLDFYLCTSLVEGGPLGVVEAELVGVPAIGPRGVGWCDQYCRYLYEPGDLASLVAVMEPLVMPRLSRTEFDAAAWAHRVYALLLNFREVPAGARVSWTPG